MNVHEQFADDLALYALGVLSGQEKLDLEEHLDNCADCRRELERLHGDAALVALSAVGPKPPSRSRERLMTAVLREPRKQHSDREKRISWFRQLGWAVAVAAIILLFVAVRQNGRLQRRIAELQTNAAGRQEELQQAKNLLATLTSAEGQHFTLVASKNPPQPQGKAIYVRNSGTLIFLASNMPALSPEKIYELWLIPTAGAPMPAGLFRPDAHGSATVVKPPLPPGIEAKTFAITIEPQTGSSAPTSSPIMVGIGE